MTETHASNGGTKVVDQKLLIDISTGDSPVVGSPTSARDIIQTIESGNSVSRRKPTSANYRENHDNSVSQLDGQRSVDGCFERPE